MHGSQFVVLATLLSLCTRCYTLDLPFTTHNVSVDGLHLFYREAGCVDNPTILLLHGSPDSSFGYRNLIPYLADAGYHVLAPDYPGFGFTEVPSSRNYNYTLSNYGDTLDLWLTSRGIKSLSMYLFDIGGPVGFYLALTGHYEIQAIIDQNAGVYSVAFGPGIAPLIDYGQNPNNQSARQALVDFLSPQYIVELYLTGAPSPAQVAPESYTIANAWLAKPGSLDVELATFKSFADGITMYPTWQRWLRDHQPPLLAIWGEHDPSQVPAGAEAFKKDLPNAEVMLVNAGHFALETALVEIGSSMVAFLKRAGVCGIVPSNYT